MCKSRKDKSDCGLFAIAFATSLARASSRPCKYNLYDQAKMRIHLIHCFETQSMTPFPSHVFRRPSDPNIEAYSNYCVCRMINDGTPMIQCSASCTEWYHMACCAVPSQFINKQKTTMEMPVLCNCSFIVIYMHVHEAGFQ